MKNCKIKHLEPCVVEFYEDEEAMLFDPLLQRVIGKNMFYVKKSKKPIRKISFIFWATEKEKKALDQAWDQIVQVKWDGIENVLENDLETRRG